VNLIAEVAQRHLLSFDEYYYLVISICNMYKVEMLRCEWMFVRIRLVASFLSSIDFPSPVAFDCYDKDGSGVLDKVSPVTCCVSPSVDRH
jgi:hypothetical protein